MLTAAFVTAAQATDDVGLPPRAALTTALTVEGLLFAALSVSYTLAQPVRGGRNRFFAQGWFGWLIVVSFGCVAASALAAWWATFRPEWPDSINEYIRAIGLLVGIVVQPIVAVVINWQATRA
jgi:hypothetical protein